MAEWFDQVEAQASILLRSEAKAQASRTLYIEPFSLGQLSKGFVMEDQRIAHSRSRWRYS